MTFKLCELLQQRRDSNFHQQKKIYDCQLLHRTFFCTLKNQTKNTDKF